MGNARAPFQGIDPVGTTLCHFPKVTQLFINAYLGA